MFLDGHVWKNYTYELGSQTKNLQFSPQRLFGQLGIH